MSLGLQPHPALAHPATVALNARADWLADGALLIEFTLQGELNALRLPSAQEGAGVADGLWQHSCFEAFIASTEGERYHEYNFAPSSAWAAYAFSSYRQRDQAWAAIEPPQIRSQRTASSLVLQAHIPAAILPDHAGVLHISLTTVIEAADGSLSYWALTHAAEKPDFHRRESFTLRLETSPT